MENKETQYCTICHRPVPMGDGKRLEGKCLCPFCWATVQLFSKE
jgi:recombinational DNA repair protein (RecF pathway)